jgi:hypothetical protein
MPPARLCTAQILLAENPVFFSRRFATSLFHAQIHDLQGIFYMAFF